MAILDSIINFFKIRPKGVTSSLINVGGLEIFAPIDDQKAIDKGFNSNTAVYSIVMTDAEKFGVIPRYVYDKRKMEEKSKKSVYQTKAVEDYVLDNKLSILLARPNEYQSQDAFYTLIRVYYKVCGEAFIWLNRGGVEGLDDATADAREVLEMYVLPAPLVTIIPDPENVWGCLGYRLQLDGKFETLRKNDVIHWKSPNIKFSATSRDHMRGMGALTPGYQTLQQNIDATRAAVRMYQNDGAKGVLANETMGSLTSTQETRLHDVIDAKVNNYDVKGSVATLQGKWNYLNILSGIDSKLIEGKEMSWKELCFLFSIPYEFFDSQVTYDNRIEAQKWWVNNEIIPASKQLDGEFNRLLLKAFKLEGSAFIGCDYYDLPEMQKDLEKLATSLSTAWWITPNEKRELMGEEPMPDKLLDEVWPQTGIGPLSQMQDSFDMEQATQELMNQNIGKNDSGGNRN